MRISTVNVNGIRAAALHQRDAEIDDLLLEALERWTALSE